MSLDVDLRGRVLVLRLNRPEARNALDPDLMRGLGEALRDADTDERVGAVVVTGTGDRAFCAGMDLRAFTVLDPDDRSHETEYVRFLRDGIAKPVIAAVNATAVAGGFELVLGCDLVVAAAGARFGLPEVKRGLFAAGGGTLLARRIPVAVALELALTGDLVDAARAFDLGLVNRVTGPDEDVVNSAVELATRVAENGPLAVQITKRLMLDAVSATPQAAWDAIARARDQVFDSADAAEGARAFVERRAPRWTGR